MMQKSSLFHRLAFTVLCFYVAGFQLPPLSAKSTEVDLSATATTCPRNLGTNFLVVAGGFAPRSNEIALEKNVLYFQRTLESFGYNRDSATVFFANGNDGQATIRYIDRQDRQQFKVPEIPHLQGAASWQNIQQWFRQMAMKRSKQPLFFYFTGHGEPERLLLWDYQELTVEQLSSHLDPLPIDTPVVMMMAQCFSGSFADFIYKNGDPSQPLALHTRCGFFATVESRPSVGCTPMVNEADYEDYSSSFFAGLSGISRTGESVASADYNRDGRVSYREAHGFAKVDEETMDWPISTSESWLQNQASEADVELISQRPIASFLSTARPEQRYVLESLTAKVNFDPEKSFQRNYATLSESQLENDVFSAYVARLIMELVNIGMEETIRDRGDRAAIADLDRLLKCESGSWQ